MAENMIARCGFVVAAAMLLARLGTVAHAQQVTVPDRPAKPVFEGQQGESRSSELHFDPRTGTVTLEFSVQDVNGYFVSNLRRQHFAVYENGVRQRNVTAQIEHAPVTLAVLVEMGGRSHEWNKRLASDAAYMIRPVLDVLGREDQIAVFAYNDSLQTIVDFETPHDKWDDALATLKAPQFSEANLYDAAVAVLERLRTKPGRKALLLFTTGLDTFSKASYQDVLDAAERSRTPIYSIALGGRARTSMLNSDTGPLARVDWTVLNQQLASLARVSGGRTYTDASVVTMGPICDDIMENLRVRYVLTYVAPQSAAAKGPRAVEVQLVNPSTGEPLRVVDASGPRVAARVLFHATYLPSQTTSEGSSTPPGS